MASNGIVGQGGRILILLADFPVRHKAQLHQRLKTIADAQHQAVPLL